MVEAPWPPATREMQSPGLEPVLVVMSLPVQPAPSKNLKVADIAGAAETRRAMARKMALNCIIVFGSVERG